MKRNRARILVATCLTFALFSASAEERGPLIDEVLSLSGVDQQINEIAAFALSEIETRKDVLPPKEYNRLESGFADAFGVKRLRETVTHAFLNNYDAARMKEWLMQLRSPLMTRMFALEKAAASKNAFTEIAEFAERSRSMPPAPSRLDLLKRLDQATSATELALDSQSAVTRSLLYAINPSLPENKRLTERELERLLSDVRIQTATTLENIAIATYLYTYRSVSNEELASYVAIYESELGNWAIAVSHKAVQRALSAATAAFKNTLVMNPQPPFGGMFVAVKSPQCRNTLHARVRPTFGDRFSSFIHNVTVMA